MAGVIGREQLEIPEAGRGGLVPALVGAGHVEHQRIAVSYTHLDVYKRQCLLYTYPACTGLSIPGPCFPHASLQF